MERILGLKEKKKEKKEEEEEEEEKEGKKERTLNKNLVWNSLP